MKLQSLTLALALAFAVGAHAQQTPAAPAAASPAKKELVQKVLKLQQPGVEAVGTAIAGQTAEQILQAAGQSLGRVPAERREAVAKEIEADVRKFYGEIEPMLKEQALKLAPAVHAPLLEARFTEDELRQLATWLEAPVARKYAELGGELQASLVQKLAADTRPAVEPKLRALEQTIRKRLGGPATPASAPAPAKKK